MNLGNFSIYSAFSFSGIISCLIILSYFAKKNYSSLATKIYFLSTLCITFSFGFLLLAFSKEEYQYAYVYNNSSKDLSLLYKVAATWAGKSGSFLLWAFLLNLLGLFALKSKKGRSFLLLGLSATQLFLLFLLIFDSPFKYIWQEFPEAFSPNFIPKDGVSLNPLLIDPWMVFHPPFLFLGYASTTIIFTQALNRMFKKNDDGNWAKKIYPWVFFTMFSLGIGIFLGAYWAYKVLGWGGYWGWDPVENSSLIPWLIILALLHGLIIEKKIQAFPKTNLLLALSSLPLVFYSTFLTRSGVLSDFSVHSFANHGIGNYLLFFILFLICTSLLFVGISFKKISGKKLTNKILAWENITSYGILILALLAFLVLIGTSMPLISKIILPEVVNLTESFYNSLSIPFGFTILIIIIAINFLTLPSSQKRSTQILITLLSFLFAFLMNFKFTSEPLPYIFSTGCWFIILQIFIDFYKRKNIKLARLIPQLSHLGVALFILGVITSNFFTTTDQKKLFLNKEENLSARQIVFKGLTSDPKSKALFELKDKNKTSQIEMAYYFDDKTNSWYKEPYITSDWGGDLYLTPDQYQETQGEKDFIILQKGQKTFFKGLNLNFFSFRTEQMTSSDPIIYADLLINGKKFSPGFKPKTQKSLTENYPHTNQKIILNSFDINTSSIEICFESQDPKKIMPASIILQASEKKFIWLVWLGMGLLVLGGLYRLASFIPRKD